MKVLVTGGAGFIGSHLSSRLIAKGAEVTVLDDLSTGSRANIAALEGSPRFRFAHGSIVDPVIVGRLVAESDVVYHLAAAVGVKYFLDHPVQSLLTNVRGTETVLAAAAKRGAKVIVASTSEVYGKREGVPFRESDDLISGPTHVPRWGYACSKAFDEFLALAYHREYGLPVIIVRFFNTVGPGQSHRYGMVVPNFIRNALRQRPLVVYGTGDQRRCFCYVGDAVRAIEYLAETPAAIGEVFNIGTTEEVSINELARRVITMTGSSSRVEHRPYELGYGENFEDMQRRVPDISKLEAVTGFRPSTSLDEILRMTIERERELLSL